MPFLSLAPYNFRNLENARIDLSAPEVFFVGKNGQGKSNLLESLYYSAYGSSFRTRNDAEIIRKGEREMSLRSLFFAPNGKTHSTFIRCDAREPGRDGHQIKRIERDGRAIRDRKELIDAIPCVLYSHEDLDFVQGAPEKKRFFFDQSLSMYDSSYIDILRQYRRILKNRNLCLKEESAEAEDLIATYDLQLSKCGLELQKARQDAVFSFNRVFTELYEKISGIVDVRIRYKPSWKVEGEGAAHGAVLSLIRRMRAQEKILGTTLSGPHRDIITFEKAGEPFLPLASMGQRRLIALTLRTCQAVLYSERHSSPPVLLMDDVLMELDTDVRRTLVRELPEYNQLFCTFLDGDLYKAYKKQSTAVYKIQNGGWERIE